MRSMKSRVPLIVCLMVTGLICSGCATANVVIPDSLRGCESTVDVSGAQTIGDLSKAILAGDGDLRVCVVKNEAIITIAEARNRSWWRLW